MENKNLNNSTLKICSKKPLTGYMRDGYCKLNEFDSGNHLVCAKTNKKFLDFTKKRGNNLYSVVKPGDKWCLCQDRYYEAFINNKAPPIIKNATNKNLKNHVKNAILSQVGGKKTKKTKKQTFLFNPDDPSKSFDVYIDKNPNDTIPIKYTTVEDVKNTIKKLERLYRQKKYTHKRIWLVAMILKVRLEAMLKHKETKYKKAKYVKERFILAKKYFEFLKKRSKAKDFNTRKKMKF